MSRRARFAAVHEFAEKIRAADAVLIATPEYNYGIPGVLKNAIDWVSRPSVNTPLRHKPVGILGASGGGFGTVRAQLQLRQVLTSVIDAYPLGKPEVMIQRAATLFDSGRQPAGRRHARARARLGRGASRLDTSAADCVGGCVPERGRSVANLARPQSLSGS